MRVVSIIIAILLAMNSPLAAQENTPPPNSSTTTNNVTAPTQQNTVTSNPVGENTNIQQNYNYNGVQAFGPGIQCNVPYISSTMYQNNQSSTSPGTGGRSTGAGSGNVGFSVGLVVPVGGAIDRNCKDLSTEVLSQRQLDTCIAVVSKGLLFNPKRYPDLARRCNDAFLQGPGLPVPPPQSQQQQISPPAPAMIIPNNPGPGSGIVVPPATPAPMRPGKPQSLSLADPGRVIIHLSNYCTQIALTQKRKLFAALKERSMQKAAIKELHAACVSDAQIVAALH